MPGLRDEDLLHSALVRPENKLAYAGEGLDLFDLAASLAYGLAAKHAFHDSNKRTAWASCRLFLRVNGIRLRAPTPEVVERVVPLASGGRDEVGLAAWLRGVRLSQREGCPGPD